MRLHLSIPLALFSAMTAVALSTGSPLFFCWPCWWWC